MTINLDANYPKFTVNGFETPIKSSLFTVTNASKVVCALCCFYLTLNFPYAIKTAQDPRAVSYGR